MILTIYLCHHCDEKPLQTSADLNTAANDRGKEFAAQISRDKGERTELCYSCFTEKGIKAPSE